MSYRPHRPGAALGATELTAAQAAVELVSDPYLSEVACQVVRLSKLEKGENPGPPCQRIPVVAATVGKGIGLRYVVKPLRVVVNAREQPILAAVAAATIIGSIFALGYIAGRAGGGRV
jgi:hypothetical protein